MGHQSVTETVLLRIKKHMVPLAEPQVVYPDADIRFHYGSAQEPVCIPELRLSAQQTKRTLSARFYGIPDRYGIDVISHSCLSCDEAGYIITDDLCGTDMPGVWAAGDCREKTVRQLTTAAADGTIAAVQACRWLSC